MRIRMEVLLRIGLGKSDRVKPCFDTSQFGSLYFGFMQSVTARSKGLYGIVDPTIERI